MHVIWGGQPIEGYKNVCPRHSLQKRQGQVGPALDVETFSELLFPFLILVTQKLFPLSHVVLVHLELFLDLDFNIGFQTLLKLGSRDLI